MIDKLPRARSCGDCHACCQFPAIDELSKPAGVLCSHVVDEACEIYAERPAPCRAYTCLWIEGEFEEPHRPKDLGLVLDHPLALEQHPDYEGIHALCARELWPEARNGLVASALLTRLARALVIRVSLHEGRSILIGPQAKVELVVARAQARAARGDPGLGAGREPGSL